MDLSKAIAPRELSVVVQGPVLPEITRRSLRSIRTHLPGAQIILSTWEGSNVEGLDYDGLVLNQDPGPIETNCIKGHNLNRLLWSTRQGLKKVDRAYCLKFRTDFELTGPQLLGYPGRFSRYLPEYQLFRERVVISSVVTWRTSRFPSGQFHPSDMFGFGRSEDIRQWWNAPLYPFENRASWENEPVLIVEDPEGRRLNEISPEQYIWMSALSRKRKTVCKINPFARDLREDLLLLLNNFIVVDPERAGVRWLKPREVPFGFEAPLLGFPEYEFLYRKHIEHRRFQMPPLTVFWKLIQLQMVKYSPAGLKGLWRIYKRMRGA